MFNASIKLRTQDNGIFEYTMQDKEYVDNLLKRIKVATNSVDQHISFHHLNGLTLIPVNVVKHSIIEVTYSTIKQGDNE